MKRTGRSIGAIMLLIGLVAVSMAALRNASYYWSSALYSIACIWLATAVVLAMVKTGKSRGFWAGASVFGWIYIVIAFHSESRPDGATPPPLLSTVVLEALSPHIFA